MNPEDILAQCLSDLERGLTPAECAARYPDIPDLEAELRAAWELRQGRTFNLRPEANRRIEAQIRQHLRSPSPAQRTGLPGLGLQWLVSLAAAVALLAGGLGVTVASAHSLPGDPLYALKRATETVELAIAPASGQAALHLQFAQHRLDELQALARRSVFDTNLMEDLTAESEAALAAIEAAPAEQQAALQGDLVDLTERELVVLQTVIAAAPPQAQAGLARALEAAQSHHAQAINLGGQGGVAEVLTPSPSGPTGESPAATPTASVLVVRIASPEDNVVVNSPQVEIKGQSAPNAVITLNDEIMVADEIGAFAGLVPLVEGPNVIEVVASNVDGLEADLQLVVTYDSGQ